MYKRIIEDLKYSLARFPGDKRRLFLWIILRALNETLTPLMVPMIIRFILDAYEGNKSVVMHSAVIGVLILPVFLLSYYIYVYSDAWVIKTMYEYQSNALENLCEIPPNILLDNYTKGDLSYVINSGAWGMIQLWMKLFRIFGPLLATVALLVYSINFFSVFCVFLVCSIILDIIAAKVQTRINFQYNEELAEVQGERDEELRYLLQKIEFLVMNDIADNELESNKAIEDRYWKILEKINSYDAKTFSIVEAVGAIYKSLIYNSVKIRFDRKGLSSGQIGSISDILGNVRDSAKNVREQVTTLPNLLVPVEKMNALMELSSDDLKSNQLEVFNNLKINHVSVKTEKKTILDDINIDIHYGDKIAIIGSNGSGKSTLIKVILNIVGISSGDILINGRNYDSLRLRDIKDIFSYLPANNLLFSKLVEDNINMNSEGKYEEEDLKNILINSAFERENADDYLKRNVAGLSGGQAQRVSFGRAIAMKKSMYLFDEPTASLDMQKANHIMEYIRNNLDTYIYTTHKVNEIEYANRVIFVKDGHIMCDLFKDQFINSDYYGCWVG